MVSRLCLEVSRPDHANRHRHWLQAFWLVCSTVPVKLHSYTPDLSFGRTSWTRHKSDTNPAVFWTGGAAAQQTQLTLAGATTVLHR
jgi:hypothetical protein